MNSDAAGEMRPAPMSGPDNLTVYSGAAHLLFNGAPCTFERGVTRDRWCAFVADSATRLPGLFVVNVTKAAARTDIRCGANGETNCLPLTRGFFEEASAPVSHAAGFQGDTLVYFDVTGTAYGWRPGMLNGRVLATPANGSVHDCMPAGHGTAIACLQDPLTPIADPSGSGAVSSNLIVGNLDGAADPPLVKVATAILSTTADTLPLFQYGFPGPAGDLFAWSSRDTPTGPSTLKTARLADLSTVTTVASDVFDWTASPDGARWYWLSQFGATSGALQAAPFPGGTAPVTLVPDAVTYQVTGAGSIVVTTAGRELRGIPDPVAAPATTATIDTGVVGFLLASDEGQVAYARTYAGQILDLVDLYVKKLDGSGTRCTMASDVTAERRVAFTPGSAALLWIRDDLNAPLGTLPNGYFTSLPDCHTTTIGSEILPLLEPAGPGGVVFVTDLTQVDGSLQLRAVTGQNTLADPILIQTRIDGVFTLSSPPYPVLFTVNAGLPGDGLHLHLVAGNSPALPDGGAGN